MYAVAWKAALTLCFIFLILLSFFKNFVLLKLSGVILSGTVAFTDPENVGLETKIVILRDPEDKISFMIGFCVMAAFKIQDGRQAVLCESGSYQK